MMEDDATEIIQRQYMQDLTDVENNNVYHQLVITTVKDTVCRKGL